MIDRVFWICVEIIQWFGNVTGLGYELANIVLFVLLQPLFIVVFFSLWIREVMKKKRRMYDKEKNNRS